MATQGSSTNAVNDTLATLESVIRLDTEATVGDLDLLVRINKRAAEQYKAMADAAEGLDTDSEFLKAKYTEVNRYIKQIDELGERVGDLEAIVKELEEWTGELEIKVRRIVPRR